MDEGGRHDGRQKHVGEKMLDGLSRLGMLGLLLAPVAVVGWAVKRLTRRGDKPASG